MKYLIRLRFDGSAYCGWQTQKNGPSVQNAVMDAVRSVFGSVNGFSGCSRTDSGVHAMDFCVSFSVPGQIPCDRLPAALNSHLPRDISVFSASEVEEEFHARYSVKRKTYSYLIDPAPIRSPFRENRVWHRPGEYDPAALTAAAQALVGTHDFTSFMAAGSKITDAVRTVFDAGFSFTADGLLEFRVSADGFLYHMVRIMVGTLITGISNGELSAVLSARDRSRAGSTAPACGLYLAKVEY